jgi:hypothetical protein
MSGAISSMVVNMKVTPCDLGAAGIAAPDGSTIARPHVRVVGRNPYFDPYSGLVAASRTAAPRLRTPSLVRMRPTWCSAVFGEMNERGDLGVRQTDADQLQHLLLADTQSRGDFVGSLWSSTAGVTKAAQQRRCSVATRIRAESFEASERCSRF